MSGTHKDKPLGRKYVEANQKPNKKQPHNSLKGSHALDREIELFLLITLQYKMPPDAVQTVWWD